MPRPVMTSPQRKTVTSRCLLTFTTFKVRRSGPKGSGGNDDPVFYRGDSRRRPGRPLGLFPLRPGADHPFQADPALLYLDRDPLRVELRAAHQRLLDPPLEVRRGREGPDRDEVAHPPDARQAVDDPFGVLLLVLPLYIAFERDPSGRDGHLEVLHRYEGVRLERAHDGRGDVRIGPLGGARKPDFELVDHRLHAVDSMDGLLGGPALAVRIDPAIELDSPVLDGHADFAGLNAAIPFQLRQHVVPDLVVGRAHGFGGGCHARSPFNQSGCGAVPPPGEDRVEEAEALRRSARATIRLHCAVIYGGGGAIGGAVARAFAREGAKVFLAGPTRARLDAVAYDITASGGIVEVAEVDALDERSVEAHAEAVAAKAGGIDIALNAVGIFHVQGTPLAEP